MGDSDETCRTIAVCNDCGALYAALEFSAKKIRPIGSRDGCQCGSTDFSAVDGDLSTFVLEDGSDDD